MDVVTRLRFWENARRVELCDLEREAYKKGWPGSNVWNQKPNKSIHNSLS